jgi:hypothetical protein
MTEKHAAYALGREARRAGKPRDSNPYLGEPGRAGIRRYTDEAAGSAWAVGFRDENDAIHGPVPELRNFVRRVRGSGR